MAEFDELRATLNTAGSEARNSSRSLFALRQKKLLAERARAERQRVAGKGRDAEPDPVLKGLDQTIAGLDAAIAGERQKLAARDAALNAGLAGFSRFTDPRRSIGQLSDATPILLLPLRIETRFKRAAEFRGASDELWVRVFPDDISIDTFEETLSESEAQLARSYWADIWRAGGNEADERGAWQVFLSGQAAGRSHWITETYQPLNAAEKPVPDAGIPTVILAIVTQAPLADPEKATVKTYWSALWSAGDDDAARLAAENTLVAALGAARADVIRKDYQPRNFADLPPLGATRAATTVTVAFLEFPDDASLPVRQSTWSQVAEARVLPDRLVLLGRVNGAETLSMLGNPIPSSLAVTPNPSAEPDDQLRPDGEDIHFDEGMRWMVNFERAIEVGMGFRVPLDQGAFRSGFDELMVLGVRLRADAHDGKAAIEDLLTDHQRSRAGFSILPQGQPTNNVEGTGAAYSWREDPDVSFDQYFKPPPADPDGWFERSDGRTLATMLGLDPAKLAAIPFYHHTDGADARAMNVALWPATLGYFMESMLHPVFDDATVGAAREFFTRHVVARGPLAAVRVGKQPYGILPATVRSRIGWPNAERPPLLAPFDKRGDAELRFLRGLYKLLRKVEADLEPLLDKVSFIGKPGGDQHQILLDVLGLHAGSVEFQQRYAESSKQLYNRLAMQGAGGAFVATLISLNYVGSGLALLSELGYTAPEGAQTPDILEKLFLKDPNLLKGDLIDDRPLSETDRIRAYTAGGENYLAWLATAARTSHEALRLQDGFANGTPTALLYLMLHHALDLSFVETSVRLFFNAGLLDAAAVKASKREPQFIQVTEASLSEPALAGDSRWSYLQRRDAIVTGNAARSVGDFIPSVLTTMQATEYLNRQLEALDHLKSRPTAALERVLAEHLDLCTYRFDAWYGGLLSYQLEGMRNRAPAGQEGAPGDGLYVGAYGWLEGVKPEFKQLTPVELAPELAAIFNAAGEPPLMRDSTNEGYIHAPSLNQAVTAAVLRNGYLSNATPENPQSLAVNLTSERVRVALSIIEGLQAGQSLGALLGYRFERGLHDRHDVEVDAFIFDLRKAFPLVADRLVPTKTGTTDENGRAIGIRRIEASNVIDGLAFVEHMKSTGIRTYPFGHAELPAASPAQAAAIAQEADRLADVADAVADLAMAESVHQVVQGNYDRAGAALDTYSKGKFPAIPDVVKTPRSGTTMTHRVALHLETGLDPADPALTSPRARAGPAVNALLATLLPPAARIAAIAVVTDPRDGSETRITVTAADLKLLPLDLLALVDPDNDRSGRILDDLIEGFVIATNAPRPDAEIAILYRDRIPALAGHVPFFELAALIRPLRDLVLRSRPLRASDMTLSAEASGDDDSDVAIALPRITLVRDVLAAQSAAIEAFRAPLQARIDASETDQIIAEMEGQIATFASLMRDLSPFAALESGTSGIFLDRRRIFAAMLGKLTDAISRWNGKLASFDQAIADFDAAPTNDDAQKFLALEAAERFIATAQRDSLPATPTAYRNDLLGTARPAFVAARDAMVALQSGSTTLGALHAGILARNAANTAFNAQPIVLADDETARLLALAGDMARRSAAIVQDVTARLTAVQAEIDSANASAEPKKKVAALTTAARLMLGEDFPIVPDFAVPPPQASEWSNAWGGGAAADTALLDYQTATLTRPFPIDDWLTGVARVRTKIKSFETAGHLSMAFGTTELALQPLQFPFRPDTPWLALDFPKLGADGQPFQLDEDKLLYTAHFATPFDESKRQAGLLVDEWTEVIPRRSEDTSISFHYDRPNTEPPQVMLLALPPQFTGAWRWEDLVDTVRETIDIARKRAIEPDQIDTTAYARFLPAIVSAVTLHPITAALNFSFNNNLAAVLNQTEKR